ncbi:apolipoprotein N-acyltransferase [Allorhodopirellula solitaria]|uniref:Apolipoprotein N-acyltransferase n=1 Tax=Allorhodopirellula solitaria TaxID=2527987 RepID=A0A5C5YC02_9BACT|nr:apolipoprotein N-acyltransferase [Allorhodopirellula solitaria]TWT73247.1 Apolipoprotein N-acyltransferase [Allorhodopirellula solitaria]
MKLISTNAWLAAIASGVLLYLTGPGFDLWPLAFVALTPLILLASHSEKSVRLPVYASFFAYYFVSLQGLRHAHPLMILPLLALAGYLAVYPLLFVVLLRRWSRCLVQPSEEAATVRTRWDRWRAHLPVALVAASLWVGGEWVRNHFATGISVLMLGHSLAGMAAPTMIQIVDLFGTYGVSFLLVLTSVAAADVCLLAMSRRGSPSRWTNDDRDRRFSRGWQTSLPIAGVAAAGAYFYGAAALTHPTAESDTTLMLIGRDEQTEYQQDLGREQQIFAAFARQTIAAVSQSPIPIDAVVWPESMLSGGQPWYIAEEDLAVPEELATGRDGPPLTVPEMRQIISQSQADFVRRNRNIQAAMSAGSTNQPPAIIGGCGIVRYGASAEQFSGIVLVGEDGTVQDTYAKNHLVMFGEYIPLIKSIPVLKEMVPAGLGLAAGVGPASFDVGGFRVLPNLCIETAVERIAVDHMRTLWKRDADLLPEAIVTLTNDAWFDHSAVVAHHLRCAQMVAIGCRRPILSAANGGPTAWIDSMGRVVSQLPAGEAGEIVAKPRIDDRVSFYVRYGAMPASVMGVLWAAGLGLCLLQRVHNRYRRRLDSGG